MSRILHLLFFLLLREARTVLADANVAIIGAGVSGLTAAWYLEKRGYSTTVYEKNDRVGGHVYSVPLPDAFQVKHMTGGIGCESGPDVSEMGGVWTPSFSGIDDFAKEMGVQTVRKTYFESAHTLTYGTNFRMEYTLKNVFFNRDSPLKFSQLCIFQKLKEIFMLTKIYVKYPELLGNSYGHAGYSSDLAIPFARFAVENGFPNLGEHLDFLVAWGYGYTTNVPAAYQLKLIYPTWLSGTVTGGLFWPCGYQSLWNEAADRLKDVRLNSEVIGIVREDDGTVKVTDVSGNEDVFDFIIIATNNLAALPSIMSVTEEEQELFSFIKPITYLTTFFRGEFNEDEDLTEVRPIDAMLFRDAFVESGIDHLVMMYTLPTGGPAMGWQILQENTTLEEAAELLIEDARMANFEVSEIQHQEYWFNYYPTVSEESFRARFHDRFEAIQGNLNTYYLDPSLSVHLTSMVHNFARDLVQRKFPDQNSFFPFTILPLP